VVIGVATAVAVLAGALLVGDSVRAEPACSWRWRGSVGRISSSVGRASSVSDLIDGDGEAQPVFAESFAGGCAMIALPVEW
jgi:hypothetical protein